MDKFQIQELKERVDIVDFIGRTVILKKASGEMKGLCPFHGEKSPSFYVSGTKRIFKCYGCGKGGDVFKFVMLRDGVRFPEALDIVKRFAT